MTEGNFQLDHRLSKGLLKYWSEFGWPKSQLPNKPNWLGKCDEDGPDHLRNKDGSPDDARNIQGLCASCHANKTASENWLTKDYINDLATYKTKTEKEGAKKAEIWWREKYDDWGSNRDARVLRYLKRNEYVAS